MSVCFFFFKQKTAYEMRISDWSSDVCSSDLNNASRAQELVRETGSLAAYVWSFEPRGEDAPYLASTSPASVAMSKDLKKRGWAFVGPTTVHAFMQAMGLINDHAEGCVTRAKVEQVRAGFVRPG